MFCVVRIVIFLAALGFAILPCHAADTLAEIKAKGEIVVGSKADFPPYGFTDKDGQIVGFEPDLAAELAKRLGVKLRLVPVLASNRFQMLREGKIDLIIATLFVTDDRKDVVGFIDPPYYAGGTGALTKTGSGIQSEDDLKGKKVCAVKGNFFNKELQSVYVQSELVMTDSILDAQKVLLEGRCVSMVFAMAMLEPLKRQEPEKWKDYELIEFSQVDPLPWAIGVKPEDRSSPYAKFLSAAVLDWHKSGVLTELEKKWRGSNSPWVIAVGDKYRKTR
jgi:polar amino acid transport system substrate-binding protein